MKHEQQSQDALAQARALADKASAAWRHLQQQGSGPIGLDFGQKSVSAVQLSRQGNSLKLKSAASSPYVATRQEVLESPELLNQTLAQLFEGAGFSGKNTVVSAPMGTPKVLSLSFKSSSPQDVPRQVLELVNERLGGADNEWLVDYLPVKLNIRNSNDTTVVAAAMRRRESVLFMQNLQTAGLYLEAVEIAPQALQRLLNHIDTPKANCLVINLGQNTSYISHFLHGRLTMDREISLGYQDFIEPISQSLELDITVASSLFHTLGFGENTEISPLLGPTFSRLKAQINLTDQYIGSQLHGDGIDCIYLTGEATNWPSACVAFSQALGYPIQTLNVFDLLETTKDLNVQAKQQASLSIAAGLAMRLSA